MTVELCNDSRLYKSMRESESYSNLLCTPTAAIIIGQINILDEEAV